MGFQARQIARVHHQPAASGNDHFFSRRELCDDLLFQLAKNGLAGLRKDFGDGTAGLDLDHRICIHELELQGVGDNSSDGRFAGAHEPDQREVVDVAWVVHWSSLRSTRESKSEMTFGGALPSIGIVLEQIAKNIRERNLFREGEHILVAVSGGVDSMVLLHVLLELASEHGWKIAVAHFNHRLRGRDSDADEKLVLETAKNMQLRVVVDAADVKARAAKSGQSIEMAARELRHAFFAHAAKKLKIKTIALAHHADDQVELFFLRLLRGASVEGLAGMRWRNASPADKSIHAVRPLLNVSRKELEAFAHEHLIRWREDKTNVSTDFLRNRVRRELIPLLEKQYQTGVRNNILRLTELLRAESEFVAAAATDALVRRPAFNKLPIALQRRVLQRQLFELGLSADFVTIESLRLNSGKTVEVNPAIRIMRDELGRVQTVKKPPTQFSTATRTIKLKANVTTEVFDNRSFSFQIVRQRDAKLSLRSNAESFDADKIGGVVTFRHWRAGDRFQPIGSNSSRKLQDMFVDLKVPKAERHRRVIGTTAEGEIFWVEGLRIGERFKLTETTARRLVVQWKRC